jgi:hypothetical protein
MSQTSAVKSAADLSQEFEARARAFADLVRGLDDEQWREICVAETWSVGTTAHHVGQSLGSTWGVAKAMLAGNLPAISWDDINAMNAAHAAEYPNPDMGETLALIEELTSSVAAEIAALNEDELRHSEVVPAFGADPLSIQRWIELVVIGHIGMHQPSIEAAAGIQ